MDSISPIDPFLHKPKPVFYLCVYQRISIASNVTCPRHFEAGTNRDRRLLRQAVQKDGRSMFAQTPRDSYN